MVIGAAAGPWPRILGTARHMAINVGTKAVMFAWIDQ
jgi:hypothetical protein